jgi:hypothetical protein
MENSTPRKQKSTDFFSPLSGKKIASNDQRQNDRSDMQCCTKNKFYLVKNFSKLCAEGVIGTYMNVLHCHEIEVNQFWAIVQSSIHLILETLNESSVPKVMLKSSGECESIQKSLWILCKQFKFSTTKLLRIECFKNLKKAIDILREVKFPLNISVMGTHFCYHHVVVVWKGMIIDYESEYTFLFTNDSLRQICGVNTSYAGISCEYGIFPPNHFQNSMDNISIEDGGIKENNIKGSSIRKYFR